MTEKLTEICSKLQDNYFCELQGSLCFDALYFKSCDYYYMRPEQFRVIKLYDEVKIDTINK